MPYGLSFQAQQLILFHQFKTGLVSFIQKS